MLNQGYIYQTAGYPFYINKRHLKIPYPYEITNITVHSEENEFGLELTRVDTETEEKNLSSYYPRLY